MTLFIIGRVKIDLLPGDISVESTDAIVCPSNLFGHMRGGLADELRRIGGDDVELEAMGKSPIPLGGAAVTSGGRLKAKWVIHSPTVRLPVEKSSARNVAAAVRAALQLADQKGFRSISFPGMGTGTGWVSYEEAAEATIGELKRFAISHGGTTLTSIRVIAHNDAFMAALLSVASRLLSEGLQA